MDYYYMQYKFTPKQSKHEARLIDEYERDYEPLGVSFLQFILCKLLPQAEATIAIEEAVMAHAPALPANSAQQQREDV